MESLRGLLAQSGDLAVAQDTEWQLGLSQKLKIVLGNVAQRIRGLALLQVWRPVCHQPLFDLRQQLFADPQLLVLGQQSFAQFRLSSCQSLQYGHQGMPGRVLKSGCVQVVQNLRIIPGVLHPRSRIPEPLADHVGEVVYVPVYDTLRPHAGPVAVLEALLSSRATDSMLVANFISITGTMLAALQLSLSNPLPQPVRRSKLEGRKPRPIHPDSSDDLKAAGAALSQQQGCPAGQHLAQLKQQQQSLPPRGAADRMCVSPDAIAAAIDAAARRLCQQQQQRPQDVPACGGSCASAAVSPFAAPCAPAATAPAVSEACSDEQHAAATVSCSTASATTAIASVAGTASLGGGACAAVATDSNLCSTLSSRPRDLSAAAAAAAGAMPPPAPCSVPASGKQLLCRARHHWEQESCDEAEGDEDGDAEVAGCGLLLGSPTRPRKMQRTLSMCRTKSVSVGLDQILEAAAQEVLGGC